MKKSLLFALMTSCISLLILGGCKKDSGAVWDDSTSMGNYKRAKERVLWGASSEGEIAMADSKLFASSDDDFVPLQDDDLKLQFSETVFMQPKESPGEENSSIPGISGFQTPYGSLATIFQTVHFNTDEYVIKNKEEIASIQKMSSYLKSHPKTYIFVEGNCDQRGPEAYNLSLGSRRANAVRNMLIQEGVNPDQIYTISYGKEKLLNSKNTPEAWAQNRRAQFKIYSK